MTSVCVMYFEFTAAERKSKQFLPKGRSLNTHLSCFMSQPAQVLLLAGFEISFDAKKPQVQIVTLICLEFFINHTNITGKGENERRCANKESLNSAASRGCLIASLHVLRAAFYSISEQLIDEQIRDLPRARSTGRHRMQFLRQNITSLLCAL